MMSYVQSQLKPTNHLPVNIFDFSFLRHKFPFRKDYVHNPLDKFCWCYPDRFLKRRGKGFTVLIGFFIEQRKAGNVSIKLSQTEIGKAIGLSRTDVNKLLARAVKYGCLIVRRNVSYANTYILKDFFMEPTTLELIQPLLLKPGTPTNILNYIIKNELLEQPQITGYQRSLPNNQYPVTANEAVQYPVPNCNTHNSSTQEIKIHKRDGNNYNQSIAEGSIHMALFRFNQTLESLTHPTLTLWGKIRLSAYPEKALIYSIGQMRKVTYVIDNKVAYLAKVCEAWCQKYNVERNQKLADTLADACNLPLGCSWTTEKDHDAPTQIPPNIAQELAYLMKEPTEQYDAKTGTPIKPKKPEDEPKITIPPHLIDTLQNAKQIPTKEQEDLLLPFYADVDIAAQLLQLFTEKESYDLLHDVMTAFLAGSAKIYWIPNKTKALRNIRLYTAQLNPQAQENLRAKSGVDWKSFARACIVNFLLGKVDHNEAHHKDMQHYKPEPYYLPTETFFM